MRFCFNVNNTTAAIDGVGRRGPGCCVHYNQKGLNTLFLSPLELGVRFVECINKFTISTLLIVTNLAGVSNTVI